MLGRLMVGLEVGIESARMVAVSRSRSDGLLVRGAAVAAVPESVPLEEILRELRAQVPGASRGVHCSLGPAGIVMHEAQFPDMPPDDLTSAVRLEAEQLIPDADNMVIDFQVVGRLTGLDGEQVKTLVVAAPKEAVEARTALLASAGIRARSVVPDGIALANAAATLLAPEARGDLLLDIGTDSTNLAAFMPGTESVSQVVRHVAGGLNLLGTTPTAEPLDARTRETLKDRWLHEVERSIQFATGKASDSATRILAVGSGADSAELLAWMEQNLSVPVQHWNPMEQLALHRKGPSESFVKSHGSHMTVALGLALMEEA